MLLGVFAFCALLGFWLLLVRAFHAVSGRLPGSARSAAVVWFARRMEVVDREGVPADFWRAALSYWPWLAWEIVKAAWDVSKIILHPRLPISPDARSLQALAAKQRRPGDAREFDYA